LCTNGSEKTSTDAPFKSFEKGENNA
jgi:hypothetical protein